MSRLTLLPGLRRLWRDRYSLQLGTDPGRAVVLDLADARMARVLDLLDGTRTPGAVLREAARLGVPEDAARTLLAVLGDAGLAVPADALLPPELIEPVRRRLAGEAAALALRGSGPGTPAEALRRRTGAHVLVSGYGRLAAPIAAALAEAGVGHVDPALTGRAGSPTPGWAACDPPTREPGAPPRPAKRWSARRPRPASGRCGTAPRRSSSRRELPGPPS